MTPPIHVYATPTSRLSMDVHTAGCMVIVRGPSNGLTNYSGGDVDGGLLMRDGLLLVVVLFVVGVVGVAGHTYSRALNITVALRLTW